MQINSLSREDQIQALAQSLSRRFMHTHFEYYKPAMRDELTLEVLKALRKAVALVQRERETLDLDLASRLQRKLELNAEDAGRRIAELREEVASLRHELSILDVIADGGLPEARAVALVLQEPREEQERDREQQKYLMECAYREGVALQAQIEERDDSIRDYVLHIRRLEKQLAERPNGADQPKSEGPSSGSARLETVFVVEGSTGEYSDSQDWPIVAFLDEADAQRFVAEADRWLLENHVAIGSHPLLDYDERHKLTCPFDPAFQCDYTGTRYSYYAVALVLQEPREEIEKLKAERDHQHQIACDVTGENIHLRNKLERLRAAEQPTAEGPSSGSARPPDWRPIATAPKDMNAVLLYWPYWTEEPVIGERNYQIRDEVDATGSDIEWFDSWHTEKWLGEDATDPGPTHWMPLPSPPSSERPRAGLDDGHFGNTGQTLATEDVAATKEPQ